MDTRLMVRFVGVALEFMLINASKICCFETSVAFKGVIIGRTINGTDLKSN